MKKVLAFGINMYMKKNGIHKIFLSLKTKHLYFFNLSLVCLENCRRWEMCEPKQSIKFIIISPTAMTFEFWLRSRSPSLKPKLTRFLTLLQMASSCVGTLLPPNHSLLFSQTKHTAAANWVPFPSTRRRRLHSAVRAETESMTTVTEKLGIKIERNPAESKLTQLGVKQWPK